MMRITLDLRTAAAQAVLSRLAASLQDRTDLHEAIAEGTGELTRRHLLDRNTASPNTNYYAKASRSVETSFDAVAATVRIPHTGIALRYYGGRVTAGKSISSATGRPTRNLAVPTPDVPVRGGERLRPNQIPDLAYIPTRKGGVSITTGYLVEGYRKTLTKGPRAGQTAIVPKPGGRLMFVLRGFTDHAPDPTVIPTPDELITAARQAATDYLTAIDRADPS
jgi:hypothetical protein